ncbi:MAG TPA: ABC transporter permease [Dongiaceae bacterium]|nr:ABC transporter permease [Dongiaceae bacterium]
MPQPLIFFLRRLFATALTVVGAVAALFLLIQFVPGDLVSVLLGPRATPALRAAITAKMGLDEPFLTRLWLFLSQAAQGDFGNDVISGRPIRDIVFEVLPNTFELAFSALGVSLLIGIPLGALAAVKPGSLIDTLLGVVSVAFITTPSFVLSIVLLLIFSISLHWLPVTGAGTPGDFGDRLDHLILPTTALALGWVGYIARLVRASLLEVLAEQHVRTLRAFGVPEWRVVLVFAMRLALVPLISVLGIGIGDLIGNAIFAEIVFARPGIGTTLYNAAASRNYPVLQAAIVIVVLTYVIANLLVDLVNGILDPRVMRARRQAA